MHLDTPHEEPAARAWRCASKLKKGGHGSADDAPGGVYTGSAPSRCNAKGKVAPLRLRRRRSRSRLARSRRGHGLLLPRCLVRKERVQDWYLLGGRAATVVAQRRAWQRQAELAGDHLARQLLLRLARLGDSVWLYPENSRYSRIASLSSSFSWLSRGRGSLVSRTAENTSAWIRARSSRRTPLASSVSRSASRSACWVGHANRHAAARKEF